MMKIKYLLILVFFISSCNTVYRDVKYTSNFIVPSKQKPVVKKTYIFSIPKGFNVDKEDYNPEFKEVIYRYSDAIKFYISDNTLAGSNLNNRNRLEKGIEMIKRKTMCDSVYMEGKQKDGRYWRENVLCDIVVGYINVPLHKKEEFDKAINSIRLVR